MTEIQLRTYLATDREAVWELHTLALERAGADARHGPWDDDLHHIAEVYLGDGGEFVVACQAGRLVGMGALKRTSLTHGEIKRMRVHPDHQRRGIGKMLLDYLEQAAWTKGCTSLHLDTTEDQTSALAFYPRNGYHEASRRKEGAFMVVYFEKTLPPITSATL